MLAPEVLRVSLVQSALVWQDVQANLAHFDALLSQVDLEEDLVVLPEMFTSGFTMQPDGISMEDQRTTLQWMHNKAAERNAALCGSVVYQENGKWYNRLLFVPPDGPPVHYDKRHLFRFAGEDRCFAPGLDRVVVVFRGWRILPQICYDLRFPESARNTGEPYDLLLYVANFPASRQWAWDQLLTARAIENQAFTLGVNRIGRDGNGVIYGGGSVILDYQGITLTHAGSEGGIVRASLDWQAQVDFRRTYPFLADMQ